MKRKKQTTTEPKEPMAIYLRNDAKMRALRVVPRIKEMSRRSNLPEGALARNLILLGLAQAEKDPAVLLRAADVARDSVE